MRVDIDFPVLFEAWPKRARDRKKIYCTTSYRADVAEVSLGETEIVLECALFPGTEEAFSMRTYGGRLYRRIAASVETAVEQRLFSEPFSVDDRRWGPKSGADWAGALDPKVLTHRRPLSKPVADEMEWRMARDSETIDLGKAAWPARRTIPLDTETFTRRIGRGCPMDQARNPVFDGLHRHRNGVRLEDVLRDVTDVSHGDIEAARDMYANRSESLLLVGGEVWMESAPLCHRVSFDFGRPYRDDVAVVRLDLAVPPEGLSTDFYTQYYDLSKKEEALSFAQERVDRLQGDAEVERSYLSDKTVETRFETGVFPAYDRDGEKIRRLAYVAAVECRRWIRRNPADVEGRLSASDVAVVDQACDLARQSDFLAGRHPYVADIAPAVCAVWKKLRYLQIMLDEEQPHTLAVKDDIKFAMAALENAPIEISKLGLTP